MQFLYHENSGNNELSLKDLDLHYVCNVRRFKVGDVIKLSNMKNNILYSYEINAKSKKEIFLVIQSKTMINPPPLGPHIIQSIIDPSEFYKILPLLNELMISKITLFYADFSQRQFRFNTSRIEKILISSCMQCSRLHRMEIEFIPNLDKVIELYPRALAFDFNCEVRNDIFENSESFIIGPEGGFSPRERRLLEGRCFSIDYNLILKSTTASVFIASRSLKL